MSTLTQQHRDAAFEQIEVRDNGQGNEDGSRGRGPPPKIAPPSLSPPAPLPPLQITSQASTSTSTSSISISSQTFLSSTFTPSSGSISSSTFSSQSIPTVTVTSSSNVSVSSNSPIQFTLSTYSSASSTYDSSSSSSPSSLLMQYTDQSSFITSPSTPQYIATTTASSSSETATQSGLAPANGGIDSPTASGKSVAAAVGGSLAGISVLLTLFLFFYMRHRRQRKSQLPSFEIQRGPNDINGMPQPISSPTQRTQPLPPHSRNVSRGINVNPDPLRSMGEVRVSIPPGSIAPVPEASSRTTVSFLSERESNHMALVPGENGIGVVISPISNLPDAAYRDLREHNSSTTFRDTSSTASTSILNINAPPSGLSPPPPLPQFPPPPRLYLTVPSPRSIKKFEKGRGRKEAGKSSGYEGDLESDEEEEEKSDTVQDMSAVGGSGNGNRRGKRRENTQSVVSDRSVGVFRSVSSWVSDQMRRVLDEGALDGSERGKGRRGVSEKKSPGRDTWYL